MGTPLANEFTSYAFDSQAEELSAKVFNTQQIQNLCNHRAIAAKELLDAKYDEHNPSLFIQRRSYLQGQIELIALILAEHDAATDQLKEELSHQRNGGIRQTSDMRTIFGS